MVSINLLLPISDENPCGPDLEREDDADFLDYYFEAESRLPERYFTPGTASDGSEDRLFDPHSVNISTEVSNIEKLLNRSRDLRLVGLLARFQILAGRLGDFADTVEDMAAMLGQWPDELHPQVDKGASDRRAAIEVLNTQATVVMPLLHLPLIPSTDTTLRRHMVAGGKAEPRASEQDVIGSDLLRPLRIDVNRQAVETTNEQLTQVADALHRIVKLASSHPDRKFVPDLAAVRAAIADMQAMISSARPDLLPWREGAAPAAVSDPEAEEVNNPADIADAGQQPITATKAGTIPTISNRATAAAALDAAKKWLVIHEPSSPALVLVTQARLLVGASLVEAIEALMPAQAGNAVLNIGRGSGFTLPMERMRSLTKTGLEVTDKIPGAVDALPAISRRGDLIGHILGVEGYFSAQEPASPVPLLLMKARDMLDKRFDAIMAELLVVPEQQS